MLMMIFVTMFDIVVRRVLFGSIRLLLDVVDVSATHHVTFTFGGCYRNYRPCASWTDVGVSNLIPMPPPINHRIINRKAEEECQRRHLESQSSQGKMCSGLVKTDRHTGNSTASRLQDQ